MIILHLQQSSALGRHAISYWEYRTGQTPHKNRKPKIMTTHTNKLTNWSPFYRLSPWRDLLEIATSEPTQQQDSTKNYAVPTANVRENDEAYTLEVEMPGVNKDAVEITFEDGKLTLTGRRAATQTNARAIYSENRPRDYRRVFDLDASLDAERITASMEQGVLTVQLPKPEAVKPRKIAVS